MKTQVAQSNSQQTQTPPVQQQADQNQQSSQLLLIDHYVANEVLNFLGEIPLSWKTVNPIIVLLRNDLTKNNPQK